MSIKKPTAATTARKIHLRFISFAPFVASFNYFSSIMVKFIVPYIKITRPANAAIAGCAVFIGMFIAKPVEAARFPHITALLAAAAAAALAYGNVINDIFDVKSDRISHPSRPLASGAISVLGAGVFAGSLALLSLLCAGLAAELRVDAMLRPGTCYGHAHDFTIYHLAATAAPIILLTLYSIYFKRTRLVGNILVAALTAYALLYGVLPYALFSYGAPHATGIKILFVPAFLAFLLNFCRELVKDVQDADGDRAAGWKTSAALPAGAVKGLLIGAAAVYTAAVLAPSLILKHFGMVYTAACVAAVIPLHIYWVILVSARSGRGQAPPQPNRSPTEAAGSDINKYAGRIGSIIKLEMIAGLLALALDRAVNYFSIQ
jgi:geranylgeranylglycerol-phosphate geranylgeranyltransferase